jgi:hypothetical protein
MCPICNRKLTKKTYRVSKLNRASERICKRCYQKLRRERNIETLKQTRFKDAQRQRKWRSSNPQKVKEAQLRSYRSLKGHVYWIWRQLLKDAKRWSLNHSVYKEFKNWSLGDSAYLSLWQQWVADEYSSDETPIVMRLVKKKGFLVDNLNWERKGQFSWWNEDSRIWAEVDNRLNEQQKLRNKGTPESRKKLRKDWLKIQQKKQLLTQATGNNTPN